MSASESEYKEEISRGIKRALSLGYNDFQDIVVFLGSPDPSFVRKLFDEIIALREETLSPDNKVDLQLKKDTARRLSSNLPLNLPAADPMLSQWWFTLDSVVQLSDLVWEMCGNEPAVFLGSPTVGFHFAHCYDNLTAILDCDHDLIKALELPDRVDKITYDVNNEINPNLKKKYSAALIDPPWYPHITNLFISRAHDFVNDNGFILCILPSRLTRPGLTSERTELLNRLLSAKFEVISLESRFVTYRVPKFEEQAFNGIDDYFGRQWRQGDLIVIKVKPESYFELPESAKPKPEEQAIVFSRNVRQRRIFLRAENAIDDLSELVVPVSEFEKNVSTRSIPLEKVALWSSDKKGLSVREPKLVYDILDLWQKGKNKQEVEEELAANKINNVHEVTAKLDNYLELWSLPSETIRRRTPEKLNDIRTVFLLDGLAAQPTKRPYPYQSDGFRIDFQRDRDRILWSHALKKLANKTQLFPVENDDHLRRRLSHSIEVMQLASTIASSFGLDRDLTEAGALVHDIGHPPFGHAGEFALNKILNDIYHPLGGFNHYEHGLDVVRWLEDVYLSPGAGGIHGLNLTNETVECIIKHAYFRNNEELGQSWLIANTKHDYLKDTSCHLEGQSVRIADKISYLISDLEDGIRMNLFRYEDLMKCRFFERSPIDLKPSKDESLFTRFISQRRAILKVIMEDILNATDRRLAKINSIDEVRKENNYVVNYSPLLEAEIGDIWQRLQAGILHKSPVVLAENMRAARIIRELFLLLAIAPELVDPAFRKSHKKLHPTDYIKWYEEKAMGKKIGIKKELLSMFSYDHIIGKNLEAEGGNWHIWVKDIVLAKDYVASLTDLAAENNYKKHCIKSG